MTTSAEAVDRPDEHAAQPTPDASSLAMGLVQLIRPRQWIKNLLVFVAPAAAGSLFHHSVFWHAAAAFGIFCVAASGTYCLNDALDAQGDRAHPTKCHRPVAAGVVSVPLAVLMGIVLLGISIGLGEVAAGWQLALVMAVYALVNVGYSLGLKNEPILDLAAVSAGFVLRAVAGGVATGVALTNWFLIVASFGSLLIVTGKRSGEKKLLSDHQSDDGPIRPTLGLYTPSFLRSVRTLAAAVTVTAYCLWAFDRAGQLHRSADPIWFQLTVIPFTIALLHVMLLLDSGEGAAPEDLAVHDHRLQLYGLCWVALFAVGVYAT
ncbi:MAG TPA: decaprenyl-phosphate phosphoribosyltransferase [Acidimicrobiales bacterium]|nr:decaprenyl-phosphate phosphoribosyltransferase [Acidimicrobiales bacterium]